MDSLRDSIAMKRLSSIDIIWSAHQDATSIFQELKNQQPRIQNELFNLRQEIPASRSCATFKSGQYLRPYGHFRAFYRQISQKSVLGFKGCDIFAEDIPQKLTELRKFRSQSANSMLQSLIQVEEKVPMAMTLPETLQEAQKAAEFQTTYLKRYGELARMPVPLLVCRWRSPQIAKFKMNLITVLTPHEKDRVHRIANKGLGALVYFYPALPIRVRHLAQLAHRCERENSIDRFHRQKKMASVFGNWPTPRETISRWITLTARILALGYSPYRISHPHNGHCIQEQNAVIDGGFADVDSLQPLDKIKDDIMFYNACMMTKEYLSLTINRFLNGYEKYDSDSPPILLSKSQLAVARRLRREITQQLRIEERNGYTIDARLFHAFDGKQWRLDHDSSLRNSHLIAPKKRI